MANISLASLSPIFELAIFHKRHWRNLVHPRKGDTCQGLASPHFSESNCSFSHLHPSIWIKHVSFPTGASERHRETQHRRGVRAQPVWGPAAWLWRLCHRRRVWLHPAGDAKPGPAVEEHLCHVHGKKAQVRGTAQRAGKEEGPKRGAKKKNPDYPIYHFLLVAASKRSTGVPNLPSSTFSWEDK